MHSNGSGICWTRKIILLLSLVGAEGEIYEKIVRPELDSDVTLTWEKAYAQRYNNYSYSLYEVNSAIDLLPLILRRSRQLQSTEGVWLGHQHSEGRGWYNSRTNETNEYLNTHESIRSPDCPACCMISRIKGTKSKRKSSYVIRLELIHCDKKAYDSPWYPRVNLNLAEMAVKNMLSDLQKLTSGQNVSLGFKK